MMMQRFLRNYRI